MAMTQIRASRVVAVVAIAFGLTFCAGARMRRIRSRRLRAALLLLRMGCGFIMWRRGGWILLLARRSANPMPATAVIEKGDIGVSLEHKFPSILFVPGWTMPGWIWQKQIDYFSRDYRVVAMDPRSQGESSQTSDGLYPAARARDIKAVVDQLHLAPVVIVSWSMAVVETLAYVDQFGTGDFAGLVLVDNDAGGRGPSDADQDFGMLKGILEDRQNSADGFIRKLNFHKPQPEDYLQKLIQASLRVPTNTAVALLVGYFVSDYRLGVAED